MAQTNTSTYTTAFGGYDNEVIENAIKSALITKLDMSRFLTPDYELVENPGMKKSIHRYTIANGSDVETLERGEGNDILIEADLNTFDYEVKRTQGTIKYFDDDLFRDPTLIDAKVRFLTESQVNSFNKRAVAEMAKSENICAVSSSWNFSDFANALGQYTAKYESTEGLFWLANQKLDSKIRKTLGDDLKYVEDYIRVGSIGTVLGVPMFLSKAVPEGLVFLATREAVKAFIKRAVAVEQSRNIEFKENTIVAATYDVIALVDESKCVVCGQAQTAGVFTLTTPTATAVAIAGAGADGAVVTAYVNGKKVGTATVSSSAYSIGCDALASNDVVKVVSHIEGKVDDIITATVA